VPGGAASARGARAGNPMAPAGRGRDPSVTVHALQPSPANRVPSAADARGARIPPATLPPSGDTRVAAPERPAQGTATVSPARNARATERSGQPPASRPASGASESARQSPGADRSCAAFDPFTGRCASAAQTR
jgi:hypothetical protein